MKNSGLMWVALILMIVLAASCKKKNSEGDPEPSITYDLYLQGYDSVLCTVVSSSPQNTQLPSAVNVVLSDSGYVWKQWVYDTQGTHECHVKVSVKESANLTLYGTFNEVPNGEIAILVYTNGQYGGGYDFHTNFKLPLR